MTGWLINSRSLFLTVMEADKFTIEVLADPASGESLLPCSQMAVFLLDYPMVKKGPGSSLGPLL